MNLDLAALQRHRRCAPLYDVYPPAEWFVEAFDTTSLGASLTSGALLGSRRLALNLRLPDADAGWPVQSLVDLPALIEAELACYGAQLPAVVDSVSTSTSSTGSASVFSVDEVLVARHSDAGMPISRLMDSVSRQFALAPGARLVLALDPTTPLADPVAAHGATDASSELGALRALGFGHVEISGHGKRRTLANETTARRCVDRAHAAGFNGIGAEYVYGLPEHTVQSVGTALAALIDSAPGHIVLRSAADIGRRFRPVLDRSRGDHASGNAIKMLVAATHQLAAAGYKCIGQDLYARADDPLAIAHRQGRLFKKPHGFSIRPVSMVLALGPGAIGAMGGSYYQNHANDADYRSAIERGRFPVMRGMLLSADDLVRRTIIHALTTDLFVDIAAIETAHRIDFRESFAAELQDLAAFEQDGLLIFDDATIELTGTGRMIAGSIAMIFDRHLRESRTRTPFLARL